MSCFVGVVASILTECCKLLLIISSFDCINSCNRVWGCASYAARLHVLLHVDYVDRESQGAA
jgi:hypothetical protein